MPRSSRSIGSIFARHGVRHISYAAVPTLSARRETIAWFRDEFERTRHETQTDKVDSLLKHGRILLKQTESGFMLSGTGEPFVKLRGERT